MKKRQFSKHQYLRKLINNILHNKNKFYLKIYFLKSELKGRKKEGKGGKREEREKGKVTSFLESFQSSLRSISWNDSWDLGPFRISRRSMLNISVLSGGILPDT